MTPNYHETIGMIEQDLPEWTWLARNNHDGRGKYFFHLNFGYDPTNAGNPFIHSFHCFGDNLSAMAFEAYNQAVIANGQNTARKQ